MIATFLTGPLSYVLALFGPLAGFSAKFKIAGIAIIALVAIYGIGYLRGGTAEKVKQANSEVERQKAISKENERIAEKVTRNLDELNRKTEKAFKEAVNENQGIEILRNHPYLQRPISDFGMRYDSTGRLFVDPEIARKSIKTHKPPPSM